MSDQIKFQNLKYKIFNKSDAEVLKIIEPLEKYAVVKRLKDGPKEQYLSTIRYMIFLFDPGTDLNRDFMRLEDRRTEAARLAKLNKIKDIAIYDAIFSCGSADVLDLIQVLLTEVYHDIDYREWQLLHSELDEYTSARWQRIEPTRRTKAKDDEEVAPTQNKSSIEAMNLKSKLREDCKRIRELIEELDHKIFGDHLDIKETAYKSRFLNPESFAMAARQPT